MRQEGCTTVRQEGCTTVRHVPVVPVRHVPVVPVRHVPLSGCTTLGMYHFRDTFWDTFLTPV